MRGMSDNNHIVFGGETISGMELYDTNRGENFYSFYVESMRSSGAIDTVCVIVSERLRAQASRGDYVVVTGEIRTWRDADRHLKVYIFAQCIETVNVLYLENQSMLRGRIVTQPVYRLSPSGREICDFLLAVRRKYNRSDYIPCIAWGRNARYISECPVGYQLTTFGRMQSREYLKALDNGVSETRTAYEMSVGILEELEETG
jgi:primosomal replication protein N